jgi:hypothetical protein
MYAAAHDQLMLHWADESLEIADDGTNDWIQREIRNKDGVVVDHQTVFNKEHVNRSRLRVDQRKWLLSKLARAQFGDVVRNEHTGMDGGPIKTQNVDELTDDQLAAIARGGRAALTKP